MDEGTRIIVAESRGDLLDGLVKSLNLAGLQATGVSSVLQFYRSIADCCYSVAVLDAELPDQSAHVLAEYLRDNTCMGVIALSAGSTVEDRVRGYGAGVDIYLEKPVDCRELIAAILRLASRLGGRGCSDSRQPSDPGAWQLLRETWTLLTPEGAAIALTAKEMLFLECIAERPGKPVRRNRLLEVLGYLDDEYTNRAMDSLVRRLRRKVEASSPQSSPIRTIHTQGYCFTAPIRIS